MCPDCAKEKASFSREALSKYNKPIKDYLYFLSITNEIPKMVSLLRNFFSLNFYDYLIGSEKVIKLKRAV